MGELNNAAHHFELSVLVIAATLSIVGAGWCQPGGLESAPERPATVRLADRMLIRRSESAGKRGNKKAGIQRTRLIQYQLRSSYPGLAVVYFGPQSGSSRTGKVLTGASEAGFCPFTGLGHCGSHPVVVDQEVLAAVRTLDRYLPMGVQGNNSGLFRTAGVLDNTLALVQ